MVTKRNTSLAFFLLLAACATASLFLATPAGAQAAGNQQVDLSSAFNQAGLFDNGVTFPATGGLDGGGDSCTIASGCADGYSAQQLGLSSTTPPTLTPASLGIPFDFGPVNTANCTTACTPDVVNLSPGVTITLPTNQQDAYSTMVMLGTAVDGSHTGTVTVTYASGSPTTTTFNQTFSDWCGFKSNANESIAVGSISRINSDGTLSTGVSCNLYAYTYPLDPTRVLQSIALTNTDGTLYTFVLAITLKPPSYTMSASTASPASITAGGSTTATVTVSPQTGYSGTVALSCSIFPTITNSAATTAPSCNFGSTSPVTVTASAPSTAMLTFTTAAPPKAMLQWQTRLFYAFWLPVPGLALIGFGLGCRGSRQRKLLGWLLFCTVLTLIFVPACVSTVHLGNVGTPPGPYTISITGVDTNGLTEAGSIPTVVVTVTQ